MSNSAAAAQRISQAVKPESTPVSITATSNLEKIAAEFSSFKAAYSIIDILVRLNDEQARSDLQLIRTELTDVKNPIKIPIELEQSKYKEDLDAAKQTTSEASESMKLPGNKRFEKLADAVKKATDSILEFGASLELAGGQAPGFESKLADISLTFAYAAEEAAKYAAAIKDVKDIGNVSVNNTLGTKSNGLPGAKTVNATHRSKLRGAGGIASKFRGTLDADIKQANEKRKAYTNLLASGTKDFDELSAAYAEYKNALSVAEKSLK